MVESSLTENQPIPESFVAGVLVGSVDGAGAGCCVSAGGTAGVAGGAVAATLADDGSPTGAPTLSLTTGAFAYGSFGVAVDVFAGLGICEWTSLTTGMWRPVCAAVPAEAGDETGVGDGAARWTSGGSGGGACSTGTFRSGNAGVGNDSVGSGLVWTESDGCRSAAAIGST